MDAPTCPLTRKKEVKRKSKLWHFILSPSQAKWKLLRTIDITRIEVFLFGHILLTELSPSVWENLDLQYRPHCVRSVLTTSVNILLCRPPVRLIRGKYYTRSRGVRSATDKSSETAWSIVTLILWQGLKHLAFHGGMPLCQLGIRSQTTYRRIVYLKFKMATKTTKKIK